MKVIFAGETKRVPEMQNLQELINYSLTIFKGEVLKAKFDSLKFYYMDEDGDIISVTCQSDFDIALGVNSSKVKLVFAEDEDEARMQLTKGANQSSDSSFFNSQFQRSNSIMNRSIISQSQYGPDQGLPQTPIINFESFIQQQIENAVRNTYVDSQRNRSASVGQQAQPGMKQRIKPIDQSVIQSIQENADEKSISNTSATNIGEIVQELNGIGVDAKQTPDTAQTIQWPSRAEAADCECTQQSENCTLAICVPEVEADRFDPDMYLGVEELFQSLASEQDLEAGDLDCARDCCHTSQVEVEQDMMEDCANQRCAECPKCPDDEMLDANKGQDTTSYAKTTEGTSNEDSTAKESVTDTGSIFSNIARFFSSLTETDGKCVLSQFYNSNQQQTIDEDEVEDWEDISQTSWQMVSDDQVDEAYETFMDSQTPMGEIVEEEEQVNQVITDQAEKSEMQDSQTPMEDEREQRVHSYQQQIVDQSFDKSYKDNLMALMQSGFTDFNQNLKSLQLTGNNLDHCQSKLLETID